MEKINEAAVNKILTQAGYIAQSSNYHKPDFRSREYFEERARAFNSARVASKDGIECDICGNKLLVQHVLELNGRFYEECEKCACVAKRAELARLKKSGMKDAIEETGEFETQNEWQRIIKSRAEKFITQSKSRCFFIGGQSGSGKTHISTLISKQLMEQGRTLLYFKWLDLIKKLNDFDNDDRQALFEKASNVQVLYIDDMLKPRGGTDFTRSEIGTTFELIDRRYVNKSCITIISSELTSQRIAAIDAAMWRRIEEMSGEYITDIAKDTSKIFRKIDWGR